MNKEVKAKWIEALESGKYKQGQEQLRNRDKYCCLGVLCDIIDTSKLCFYSSEGLYEYNSDEGSYETILPYSLRAKLGITSEQESDLIQLNDAEDYDFPAIADWIKENL